MSCTSRTKHKNENSYLSLGERCVTRPSAGNLWISLQENCAHFLFILYSRTRKKIRNAHHSFVFRYIPLIFDGTERPACYLLSTLAFVQFVNQAAICLQPRTGNQEVASVLKTQWTSTFLVDVTYTVDFLVSACMQQFSFYIHQHLETNRFHLLLLLINNDRANDAAQNQRDITIVLLCCKNVIHILKCPIANKLLSADLQG